MLELVRFNNIRAAYALADYLNVTGVACRVQPEGQQAVIYLQRETDMPRAQQELQAFLDNPADKKYLSASWEQSGNSEQQPEMERFYQEAAGKTPGRWQQTGLFTKFISLGVGAR